MTGRSYPAPHPFVGWCLGYFLPSPSDLLFIYYINLPVCVYSILLSVFISISLSFYFLSFPITLNLTYVECIYLAVLYCVCTYCKYPFCVNYLYVLSVFLSYISTCYIYRIFYWFTVQFYLSTWYYYLRYLFCVHIWQSYLSTFFLSFSSSIYFLYLFYVSTFYIYLLYLSSPSICQLIFYLPDLLHSDKKMSSQIPISPGRTEIMINFYFLAKMRTYTYISNIFPCIYKYSMMILITLPSPLRFIIPSAHLLVIFLSTPFTPQILQYHTVTLPAISVFFKRDT